MAQLKPLWDLLKRRWLIVVVLAAVGAGGGFGFSKLQEPTFRSSAKLYVMPARPDNGNTLTIQNVVRQYGQLMVSDRFLEGISRGLNLGLSVEEMRKRVSASGVVEYQQVLADVDDPDPAQARAIAGRLVRDFIRDQETRMKNVDQSSRIDVIAYDDPTPAVLHRPQTTTNVAAATLLGLLLATGVIALLELPLLAQLTPYWAILRRRWAIVVTLVVVGGAAGFGFSKLQEPTFRSSAKVYLMPARPDYGTTLTIQNVVRQYGQLMVSDRFLRSASEDLKLDLPLSEMRKRVTASGVVEFQQILMDVDDSDAGRARAIARKLVQDFIQDQDGRMKHVDPSNRIDVFAYDDPTPATLHRPQTRTNVIASTFLGLLVSLGLVYLLETQSSPIRTPEEVERRRGQPVTGKIPATS